jgi:hypothetical protein
MYASFLGLFVPPKWRDGDFPAAAIGGSSLTALRAGHAINDNIQREKS